jgi:hypothetical protein
VFLHVDLASQFLLALVASGIVTSCLFLQLRFVVNPKFSIYYCLSCQVYVWSDAFVDAVLN